MSLVQPPTQTHISSLYLDGGRISVSLRIVFDGIEFVGKLWFTDESLGEQAINDRALLPGRTRDEALALAVRLSPEELVLRYRRALSEKRKFHELRRATDEVLNKIRYLNQVSLSMQRGLLDTEGASQELELTEKQLHALIDQMRNYAGRNDG